MKIAAPAIVRALKGLLTAKITPREDLFMDEYTERYNGVVEDLRSPQFPINLFGLYRCPEHGEFHVVWFDCDVRPSLNYCPVCRRPLQVAK